MGKVYVIIGFEVSKTIFAIIFNSSFAFSLKESNTISNIKFQPLSFTTESSGSKKALFSISRGLFLTV